MILAAKIDATTVVSSVVMFLATASAVFVGYRPLAAFIRRRERQFDDVLRGKLLMDIHPRAATAASGAVMLLLALMAFGVTGSLLGLVAGAGVGLLVPPVVLRGLRRRRLQKLEDQLVPGVQTLASGVRAGLNLVQSLELVARDGPKPLREEISHLVREYAYGVPLEEAMSKAAARIGSGDYRLLFAALQTHRERGGDLGQTLDRIADSIREIQRLEKRVEALTAQGRANARWLAVMPVFVFAVLYLLIDREGTEAVFHTDIGKLIIFAIVVLNVVGFLWIKKIVSVDI